MTTRLPFRKTTAAVTVIAFWLTVGFAQSGLAQVTSAPKHKAARQTTSTSQPTATPTAPPPPTAVPAKRTNLQIEHDPLACVTTVAAPVVDAKVQPGDDMAASRVFFRAAGTPYYYYVVMAGSPADLKGTLPRPLPETKTIDYYVQATDKASLSKKTPDYAPTVSADNVCKVPGQKVGKKGAGITIGLTEEKQPPVPAGFNKADIAKVILVTGAVVTLAAAAAAAASGGTAAAGAGASAGAAGAGSGAAAGAGAAGGAAAAAGGISSTVLIAGGVAAAAGVGAAVASSSGSNPTPTPTRTPTRTPVPNHFIQVEATWSGPGKVDTIVVTNTDTHTQVSGQLLPAGCTSTASRTTRFVAQGSSVANGHYQVSLQGGSCGAGAPAEIATLVTVDTDGGVKCPSAIVNVPSSGSSMPGCSFSIP